MKKSEHHRSRVSQKFVTALAIVSIIGFASIVTQTIFNYDITAYVEVSLMLIIGVGLIIEARIKKLKSLERGITSNNITHLTTIVIGVIAILAGIFSIPAIRLENPAFLAIKGIMSVIAIIVITIQTWIID